VLYHPAHAFNVDRMLASMKASLDYCTAHFSPYQFRQLRIVEFPRYAQYALALPGTVPFSEAAGFIARPGDGPDDLDMPFYVTAHEVAHQWWGHQVAGANVQGYAWLSEGLANYSALTVLEHRYGRERLQKFLAYELDQYLLGRGAERKGERPLMLVEGQPYIHYNKGSLALYAYRELIGEAAMNRALAKFVAAKAFSGPPYPTSRDLIAALRTETPDSLAYAITDLFETITLWDNRTESAVASPRADGAYDVAISVHARKARADSIGTEREIAMGDLIDIGVFGADTPGSRLGAPLYRQKVWVRSADTTFTVVVKERPVRAGIDPYNVLIDRDRRDNVKTVTFAPPRR
jgi:aminopeptidase N